MRARLRRLWKAERGREALDSKRAERGAGGPCHEGPEHVAAWLDVMCRLMRLPRTETLAIREELEEHLRERVRDLMVEGESEEGAARRAIGELGDAAAVADRFRRAGTEPRRRLLMNIAMMGAAAVLAVGGAVGLNRMATPPGGMGAGMASPPQVRFASPDVAQKTITLPADATVDKLVQELGRVSGHGTHVYWETLKQMDVESGTRLGVPMSGVTVETALMLANERFGKSNERIACRLTGDLLEVSTLQHFDKRDVTLVAYDVEAALAVIPGRGDAGDSAPELTKLITSVVDSEQWRENGGELAELHVVGPKLFVKAPARFQPTIQWILAQLGSTKAGASANAGAGDEAMQITAKGSRVTMSRGLGSLTADSITLMPPGKDDLVAGGKGVVAVGAVSDPTRVSTYSITGQIERSGVYCMPKEGLSVRRAIVAAGGKFDGVKEVVVSKTENGLVTVTHRLKGEELRTAGAQDPMLTDGEVVEVK